MKKPLKCPSPSLGKRRILVDLNQCLNWLEKGISYERKTTKNAFKDEFLGKRNKNKQQDQGKGEYANFKTLQD